MLPVWTVVLAAGSGRRLAGVTGGVPKQFWRPASGGRSMLESTLDRLASVSRPERTVVVVDRTHRPHVDQAAISRELMLFQPEDRGTAAGVALGLLPALAADPDAIVVITPSDHAIADERTFRQNLRSAIAHVGRTGTGVLFGVRPTAPAEDYGWITLSPADGRAPFRHVQSFVEKPASIARELYASGALWNTMLVVARAEFIANLYRQYLAPLADVFDAARRTPAPERAAFLDAAYAHLAPADFSRDLLAHARTLDVRKWPLSIGWSDLGTPDRLWQWLARGPAPQSPRPHATLSMAS